MSYQEERLQEITDAIRSVTGSSEKIKGTDIASEVSKLKNPSGTLLIEENGTFDVTNYANAEVDINIVTPSGIKTINENGTHDVKDYAFAEVKVEPNLITKEVTENGTYKASDDGADGYSSFTVNVASSGGGGSGGGFDRTFANNTPEQIAKASAIISYNNMTSAQVAETFGWNIGDTTDITLTTGEAIQMRIIGFNHDDKSDGSGKAGITLDMVGVLNTTYLMNNTNTSEGGWRSCNLRTSIFPTIKATLPSEWQNIIKMVNKKSAYDGTLDTIVTSSDHLFLLAEIEVHGDTFYGSPDEGVVYEYWNGKDSTAKKKTYQWWLRGPRMSSSNKYFCCVMNGSFGQYMANQTNVSVSFAFCV